MSLLLITAVEQQSRSTLKDWHRGHEGGKGADLLQLVGKEDKCSLVYSHPLLRIVAKEEESEYQRGSVDLKMAHNEFRYRQYIYRWNIMGDLVPMTTNSQLTSFSVSQIVVAAESCHISSITFARSVCGICWFAHCQLCESFKVWYIFFGL